MLVETVISVLALIGSTPQMPADKRWYGTAEAIAELEAQRELGLNTFVGKPKKDQKYPGKKRFRRKG